MTKAEATQLAVKFAKTLIHKCANPACSECLFGEFKQKYCSPACAAIGAKASKNRWWRAHGKGWRKSRKAD